MLLALASLVACAPAALRGPAAEAPLVVQGKLTADALWRGTIVLADDLLIPRGRTLRVLAGTRIVVRPADTTKTEPEYLDNATELLVRGTLLVEGTARRPVVIEPEPAAPGEEPARWAGIIFDGGAGVIRQARLAGAETGITLLGASPVLADLTLTGVRAGISVHGDSAPRLLRVSVHAEEGGVLCWPGSRPSLDAVTSVAGEHEGLLVAPGAAPEIRASVFRGGVADILWAAAFEPPGELAGPRLIRVPAPAGGGAPDVAAAPPPPPFEPRVPPPAAPARTYRGEQFIGEDTRWEGEILVDGTVMVAPVATLTIAPGAVVRFAFRDSDGDGLGESEVFIQGRLLAEGRADAPIVFTALDGTGRGRWGAINLMGGDAEESRLAWCLIERGFRGLHGHFARFRVERSIFRDNYRSVQFQESTAAIVDCSISGSASALRFRDSTAAIEGLSVLDNTLGLQVLRSSFSLTRSAILRNALAGMHVRESEGTIAGNRFAANAPGLRASECRLRVEGNRFAGNAVAAILVRRSEGRIEGNALTASAGNGVSTDSPRALLRGNAIEGSLRFALESNTAEAIDAVGNWWGRREGPPGEAIWDAADDAALGPVLTDPPLGAPPALP